MRFIVLGGGCYGTFYSRQLLRARDAGALDVAEIIVLDHNRQCQAARELPPDPVVTFAVSDWEPWLDQYWSALDPSSDSPANRMRKFRRAGL